jgi:hypothetical protein
MCWKRGAGRGGGHLHSWRALPLPLQPQHGLRLPSSWHPWPQPARYPQAPGPGGSSWRSRCRGSTPLSPSPFSGRATAPASSAIALLPRAQRWRLGRHLQQASAAPPPKYMHLLLRWRWSRARHPAFLAAPARSMASLRPVHPLLPAARAAVQQERLHRPWSRLPLQQQRRQQQPQGSRQRAAASRAQQLRCSLGAPSLKRGAAAQQQPMDSSRQRRQQLKQRHQARPFLVPRPKPRIQEQGQGQQALLRHRKPQRRSPRRRRRPQQPAGCLQPSPPPGLQRLRPGPPSRRCQPPQELHHHHGLPPPRQALPPRRQQQ